MPDPGYYLNPQNWNWQDSAAMPSPPAAGPFPAANSVDWLQRRLPKPIGDWLGNAYEQGQSRANDLSPRTVAGEVIGGALNLMPAGRMAVPRPGIRAYHGSPHDFDKFDLSKIGTGEGAQAYGHGLYFAENPKTAQSYRDTLAPRVISDQGEHLASLYLQKAPDRAAAIASLERDFATARSSPRDYQPLDVHQRALDLLRSDYKPNHGKMYEVNINAKPEQFLDWEKPLRQQSPDVQSAISGMRLKDPLGGIIGEPTNVMASGQEAYRSLARASVSAADLRPGFEARSPFRASEVLRDAGIPGIRYLDQGSRLTGSSNVEQLVQSHGSREKAMEFAQSQVGKFDPGRPTHKYWTDMAQELKDYKPRTSNYVLFNDSIIDILKKWGLVGAMGGAANYDPANPPAMVQ